ncbi:tachykinin-like peptides receptor 99D [Tachypleus tridentatus]
MAIMHPLRPRMSRKITLIITVCIWVAGSFLSLPNLVYSTTITETFRNGDHRIICFMVWPDGYSNDSYTEYIYNVNILVLTYILPISSMTFTYFRVGRELWGSKTIGECTEKQLETIKSKRKVVKMMIVVVFIFTVCWLPYHIYFLLAHHHPQIISTNYVQHIYLSIYWLAMSNSMYNPIIYCWMNSRFRRGFKKVFMMSFCCGQTETIGLYDQRHHTGGRHSYSDPYTDTKVTFNGSVKVTRKSLNGSRSSGTSSKFVDMEILSSV